MSSFSIALLLLPFCAASQVAVCFYREEVSPWRYEIGRDHYPSRPQCENVCVSRPDCKAYFYSEPHCVLLGAVSGAPCKCDIFIRQDCLSTANDAYPTATGRLQFFPICVKSDGYTFVNPDPQYLICTSNACRCKGTALMPFDNSDGSRRYFPFMGMDEEGSWVGFSAYARGTDKKNDGRATCVDYTPASYQLCGDLYTYDGMQKGDLPCGVNKFSYWTVGAKNYTSTLTCAPEGWMADGLVVRPEFVHCINDS